jgi:hypothetical protein
MKKRFWTTYGAIMAAVATILLAALGVYCETKAVNKGIKVMQGCVQISRMLLDIEFAKRP